MFQLYLLVILNIKHFAVYHMSIYYQVSLVASIILSVGVSVGHLFVISSLIYKQVIFYKDVMI